MSLGASARIGLGAARHKLTGEAAPLTAFLALTWRCDALCAYCTVPFRAPRAELCTPEWLGILDDLADNGCQRLILGGGEPLVRPDLPRLVARARARRLWTRLETSGSGYPERAAELPVDHVSVSIDGAREAHDANREPGSFDVAVAALEEAARLGVARSTVTVVTRHNVGRLGEALEVAEAFGALAFFRLVHPSGSDRVGAMAASDAEIRSALRFLLDARHRGRAVGHPRKTLETLLAWGDLSRHEVTEEREGHECSAGQTHLFIDADGAAYACRRRTACGATADARLGIREALAALSKDGCRACTALDLREMNDLHRLNLPTLLGWVYTVAR